jgi:hypothetical protein
MLLLTSHPAAAFTGSYTARRRPVLLASPLDMETYVLRFPRRRDPPAGIRDEIRSRYPGDLSRADYDIKMITREHDENGLPCVRAAVFVTGAETAARYREKRDPVIPGAALLTAACNALFPKKAGPSRALVLLVSDAYLEAAVFEDRLMKDHLAFNRKTVDPPLGLLDELCAPLLAASRVDAPGTDTAPDLSGAPAVLSEPGAPAGYGEPAVPGASTGSIPAAIILDGVTENDTCVAVLARHFTGCRIVPIGDFAGKINAKRERIFRTRRRLPAWGLLLFSALLAVCSLLPFLRSSITRMERTGADLARTLDEAARRRETAAELTGAIRLLEAPDSAEIAAAGQHTSAYGIIAELYRRLPGCRIRSLNIRDDRFTLEAEGRDSLGALASLENSRLFAGVTLHQTTPEPGLGEVFSLSGSIRHGE